MKPASGDVIVSALLIGEYQVDRLLLHELFERLGWRIFEARDREHALQCLKRAPIQVVLGEDGGVPNWSWRSMLADLRGYQPTPLLVVASRLADDFLWAEALNEGAYDVLAQPLDRDEVQRVVSSARRHFDFGPARARTAGPQAAGAS